MAAVVRGAEGEPWEERDEEGSHCWLGGVKGFAASAIEQEAESHAGGHVIPIEDSTSSVIRSL